MSQILWVPENFFTSSETTLRVLKTMTWEGPRTLPSSLIAFPRTMEKNSPGTRVYRRMTIHKYGADKGSTSWIDPTIFYRKVILTLAELLFVKSIKLSPWKKTIRQYFLQTYQLLRAKNLVSRYSADLVPGQNIE